MGKRESHICDVCKHDLPFDGMFPKFRAAEVRIQLHKSGWGDTEWLAGWKGELCDECVAIINRTAEVFHRELALRLKHVQPGERVSSPEAELPSATVISPKAKRSRRQPRAQASADETDDGHRLQTPAEVAHERNDNIVGAPGVPHTMWRKGVDGLARPIEPEPNTANVRARQAAGQHVSFLDSIQARPPELDDPLAVLVDDYLAKHEAAVAAGHRRELDLKKGEPEPSTRLFIEAHNLRARAFKALRDARARPIDELIAGSSIGQGLANIREHGIDAELADLASTRKAASSTRKKARATRNEAHAAKKRPQARAKPLTGRRR